MITKKNRIYFLVSDLIVFIMSFSITAFFVVYNIKYQLFDEALPITILAYILPLTMLYYADIYSSDTTRSIKLNKFSQTFRSIIYMLILILTFVSLITFYKIFISGIIFLIFSVASISLMLFLRDKLPIKQNDSELLLHQNNISNLKEYLVKEISERKLSRVVIADNKLSYDQVVEIIEILQNYNLSIYVNTDHFNIIKKINNTDEIEIKRNYLNRSYMQMKRISDVIFTSIGLVFLIPVFLTISVLIKLSSKGPIIYKQVRIGKDGKQFDFYKFRSMRTISGEDEERKQLMIEFMVNGINQSDTDKKIINENRVTKIGRILRKTSLDELPQLFNVLKGDMSLVGPRPCLDYEYDHYEDWQKRRHKVIPGCTGLWQISGRSSVSFKDSTVIDYFYINNMSPWMDLKILFKTIPVMLLAKGGK